MSWLFQAGGQSTGASASSSVLAKNIWGWFPLGLTDLISLLSKGLSRVFNTTTWKHQFFGTQPSLCVYLLLFIYKCGRNWRRLWQPTEEGNGNPLQCSCLENPKDGGAWWAAISGVAQSQTGLKWLSSSSNMATHSSILIPRKSYRQRSLLGKSVESLESVEKARLTKHRSHHVPNSWFLNPKTELIQIDIWMTHTIWILSTCF